MPRRRLKDRLYEQLARIGKAAGSGRRLELLEILAQGERTVEKLARETGLSVANASHHLRVLRQARLVDSRTTACGDSRPQAAVQMTAQVRPQTDETKTPLPPPSAITR